MAGSYVTFTLVLIIHFSFLLKPIHLGLLKVPQQDWDSVPSPLVPLTPSELPLFVPVPITRLRKAEGTPYLPEHVHLRSCAGLHKLTDLLLLARI